MLILGSILNVKNFNIYTKVLLHFEIEFLMFLHW